MKFNSLAKCVSAGLLLVVGGGLSLLPAQVSSTKPALVSLLSKGNVKVDGTKVPQNATVTSGGRIVTEKDSTAMANLGPNGYLFIAENSEVVVKWDDAGANVELVSGSVRVQKPEQVKVDIWARNCNQVDVINGEVAVWWPEDKAKDARKLQTGDSEEYRMLAQHVLTAPASTATAYRVSIIDCKTGLVAVPPAGFPVLAVAAAVAGATTAATIPTLTGGDDDEPVSRSRP